MIIFNGVSNGIPDRLESRQCSIVAFDELLLQDAVVDGADEGSSCAEGAAADAPKRPKRHQSAPKRTRPRARFRILFPQPTEDVVRAPLRPPRVRRRLPLPLAAAAAPAGPAARRGRDASCGQRRTTWLGRRGHTSRRAAFNATLPAADARIRDAAAVSAATILRAACGHANSAAVAAARLNTRDDDDAAAAAGRARRGENAAPIAGRYATTGGIYFVARSRAATATAAAATAVASAPMPPQPMPVAEEAAALEDDAMAIDENYAVEQPAPAAVSFASSSALILSPSGGMDVSLTSPNPLPAAFDAVSNSNGPASRKRKAHLFNVLQQYADVPGAPAGYTSSSLPSLSGSSSGNYYGGGTGGSMHGLPHAGSYARLLVSDTGNGSAFGAIPSRDGSSAAAGAGGGAGGARSSIGGGLIVPSTGLIGGADSLGPMPKRRAAARAHA